MTSGGNGRCSRFSDPPTQGGRNGHIGSDRSVDCGFNCDVGGGYLPGQDCRHGSRCQTAECAARTLWRFLCRQIAMPGTIDGGPVSARRTDDREGIGSGRRHRPLRSAAQQPLDQQQEGDQQRDGAGRYPIPQEAPHGSHTLIHATGVPRCHSDRYASAADCLLFPKGLGFQTIRYSMDERHGSQRQTHPPHHFRRDRGL